MRAAYDIPGFCQRSAWAGSGSFPFGLHGCNGWIAPARRLSNIVASLNRLPGSQSRYRLISLIPYLSGTYCVIRYQREVRSESLALMTDIRFRSALNRTTKMCLSMCQTCGRPAVPAILGGVYCEKHAVKPFAFEVVADPRKIRRLRRGWCHAARATIAGYSEEHVRGACMLTYSIGGQHYLRSNDAPPGGRQQVFEHMVESGYEPEEIQGQWVFRITGSRQAGK